LAPESIIARLLLPCAYRRKADLGREKLPP
jgi:hypothetical protein